MSEFDYDAELDAILAEFSGKKNEEPETNIPSALRTETYMADEDATRRFEDLPKPSRVKSFESVEEPEPKPKPSPVTGHRTERRTEPKTEPEYNSKQRSGSNIVQRLLSILFAIAGIIVLAWVAVNIHPGDSMTGSSATTNSANITSKINSYTNTAGAVIKSMIDGTEVKIHYTLDEEPAVPPKAKSYNYGTTTIDNLQPVLEVIQQARDSGLIGEDENVVFSTGVEFYHDPEISADIQYYYDETIMVICWKELIEDRVCSCVEVKIADGSQIRRKLCEDTYDSSVYLFATDLAKQTNAVVAMNADYYAFRNLGITVYGRTLYRFNEFSYSGFYQAYNSIDTLFINDNGDFIFFKRGQQSSAGEMQQYINSNGIRFAIAFGPVLVENGEVQYCDGYPVGEINSEYSRAGIAQCGDKHYLYMAVSHAWDATHPRCTVNEFAGYMASKGVVNAYCLDGGQTGEVVFNGAPFNHIDFGNERTVSDIIYFATALPEEVS